MYWLVTMVIRTGKNNKRHNTLYNKLYSEIQLSCFYSYLCDLSRINTRSVIEAVHDYANSLRATLVNSAKAVLLFGLDANSYSIPDSEHLGVEELGEIIRDFNLESNWGQHPSPTEYTTYNARTYLQPQLNKVRLTNIQVTLNLCQLFFF